MNLIPGIRIRRAIAVVACIVFSGLSSPVFGGTAGTAGTTKCICGCYSSVANKVLYYPGSDTDVEWCSNQSTNDVTQACSNAGMANGNSCNPQGHPKGDKTPDVNGKYEICAGYTGTCP